MRYDGITFSQTAVNEVLADIRDGVTYPDFWDNRYSDDPETEDQPKQAEEQKPAQK